jgi:integrase/recombinase XerC
MTLPQIVLHALNDYLEQRERKGLISPFLFLNVSHNSTVENINPTSMSRVFRELASCNGYKPRNFHSIRHASVTQGLDLTNGNHRSVQAMSRHKKLETILIYDDKRNNAQGQVSSMLASKIETDLMANNIKENHV